MPDEWRRSDGGGRPPPDFDLNRGVLRPWVVFDRHPVDSSVRLTKYRGQGPCVSI